MMRKDLGEYLKMGTDYINQRKIKNGTNSFFTVIKKPFTKTHTLVPAFSCKCTCLSNKHYPLGTYKSCHECY